MGKKSSLNRAFSRLTRAFAAKDERAFEDAMDEIEEKIEERGGEDEQPEIEVHNHVPDFHSMTDTARGELPEKDPPGFDRRSRDNEAPPWFEEHKKASDAMFKKMNDAIENLKKWAEQEEKEPEHQEDRRDNEFAEEEDPSLEMSDRRRNNDEPAERQEMAERIKEHGGDRRRNSDRRDEANKEILGELEFEAPPGTGDKARRATDSRYLEDAFQDAVSKAEQLVPGITLPTFDAKAKPAVTLSQIKKLRKTALDLAYNQAETRDIIDNAISGRTFDSKSMAHQATAVLFNAAASAMGSNNNRRSTDRSQTRDNGHQTAAGVQSLGDLNKRNREFYAGNTRH